MQDNDPLMRSLGKLVYMNNPDLILFVGEALVGNDAAHQLKKFNQAIADASVQVRHSSAAAGAAVAVAVVAAVVAAGDDAVTAVAVAVVAAVAVAAAGGDAVAAVAVAVVAAVAVAAAGGDAVAAAAAPGPCVLSVQCIIIRMMFLFSSVFLCLLYLK